MARLGVSVADATRGNEVFLSDEARRLGTYLIGAPGTGKTTCLKSIAIGDMNDPNRPGLIVLDAHGDMINDLLLQVPTHRKNDAILFAPGEKGGQYNFPLGLNLLACNRHDDHERELVASTLISTLYKLFSYSWGARMEDILRNGILTLLEREGSTLLDLWKFLVDQSQRTKEFGTFVEVADAFQWRFWNSLFASYTPHDKGEIVGSSLNKIGRFLSNPMIRTIVGQPHNAFDISRVMDRGGILFCNLSKGQLGEDNSALLGSVIINMILMATLRRVTQKEEDRRIYHVIVDEYQSFATESFPTLQAEARKYGVTITVAHQYRDQLDDENKGSSMIASNFVCLRVSGRDSLELANQFDNTPPKPDTIWQPVRYPVRPEVYAHPNGTVYERDSSYDLPVAGPRRLYTDIAAERANQLSVIPNKQALCRLMDADNPRTHYIALDNLDVPPKTDEEAQERQAIADYIRQRSLERGKDRKHIEEYLQRKLNIIPIVGSEPPQAR